MAGNPALTIGEYTPTCDQSGLEADTKVQLAPQGPVISGAGTTAQSVTAIFPMKGQSERIPGKNLRLFCDKPLFSWTLGELAACPSIMRIIVDTDSEEIARLVVGLPKVCVHERPTHLWGNHVSMNEILDWVLTHDTQGNDHYLQSHATNPLLQRGTVEKAIATYFASLATHDSLFSVTELYTRLYDFKGNAINHDPTMLSNTQDLPPVFEENSNLYIFSRESFVQAGKRRIGLTPLMFSISKYEAFDIDTEEDFRLAEAALCMTRGCSIRLGE